MESINIKKERHGGVTAWLVVLVFSNLFMAFIYIFDIENLVGILSVKGMSLYWRILFGIIAIFNFTCIILLLKWKKWGFWGLVISGICVFAINVFNGSGFIPSIQGMFGLAILYWILQIRKNDISAWVNLE